VNRHRWANNPSSKLCSDSLTRVEFTPENEAHILLFPKPKYKGPENVTYFLGDEFEKELTKDKKVRWLIEFYATWNPDCNEFAGVFGELSAKYANKNLKFGKIDVARSPKIADKYNIIASVTSRTLPTLILFRDGREFMRRPLIDTRERVVPFSFSFVSIRFIWIVTPPYSFKLVTNHVI
jgi:thiol-disulfide isomerase/thioredoxin